MNATPITSGSLDSSDSFTSENPFTFEQGAGGDAAIIQRVFVGDEITLELAKTSTFAEFVGMRLTVSVSPPCPVLTTLRDAPARDLLGTIYRLRNERLSRTPRGRRYIALFYRHALETSWILTRHPDLRARTRWLLRRLHPELRQALAGRPVSLTWGKRAAVERLMDAFAIRASPGLRETIHFLRSELRSGRLASELVRR